MKTINCATLFLTLTAIGACSDPEPPVSFSMVSVAIPTTNTASSPRLSSGPDGELLLSWLEPLDTDVQLRFAAYRDGGWDDAKTVASSENMFVNWADLPSVVPLGGPRLAAHWLLMTTHHAYDIAIAESTDGGESWSTPVTPHTDGTETEHGFVSIYPRGDGVDLLWLDGRKMVNEVGDDPVASGMMLRSSDQVIDELVCDCCQTDVAIAASGPVAVYRDRSVDEIRDIYVTRMVGGEWQTGQPIADDNWHIAGCPVNGPSITAHEDRVAVAWFSAAGVAVVRMATSQDGGINFSAPVEIVRNATLGRVSIALLDNGEAAVSWLESASPESAAVKVRRVLADGTLGPVRLVADTANGFSVPQMERHGGNLIFAWTESTIRGTRVASGRVAIDKL